jgi:hypothetical protein
MLHVPRIALAARQPRPSAMEACGKRVHPFTLSRFHAFTLSRFHAFTLSHLSIWSRAVSNLRGSARSLSPSRRKHKRTIARYVLKTMLRCSDIVSDVPRPKPDLAMATPDE